MEIVYSTRPVADRGDRAFRNPRFFTKPEPDVTQVFIAGSWPHVADAYRRAGVPVADVGEMRAPEAAIEAPEPVVKPKRRRRKAR